MPITITISANNAMEAKQLVHDLAYAIFRLPAEEITDTEVSTVEASGAPVASAEQPAAQVAPEPAQTAPTAAPVAAPASVPQISAPQSAAPTAPTAAPAAQPSNSAAPTAPASAPTAAPTTPPTAPTSVPQYDFNQLAVATMQLQQAGHNIFEIFQQFGITALNQLPKERYGEYAAVLRQRGAKI
ncbi:MAG: hypothetical protein BAA01_11750 [Bacillus thermozeamaize]|uniref:Uncharacterized protein n=1 Tax=Bacillus thermozeamaize TaxID=230954 RepID=A0A1Y3PH50_9BACI|nr:MAG: hypothetical protein BAA01_11750 [Bacillus thermozeamaize]